MTRSQVKFEQQVTVRLPQPLVDELVRQAEAERRPLRSKIRQILVDAAAAGAVARREAA